MPRRSIGSLITPLVLTYNEELNIHRTLESLQWADRVVVLDSGSTDATETIARRFANVDWRFHSFSSFKTQYEHGVHASGIDTPYVLALDADMVVSPEARAEIKARFMDEKYAGGLFSFQFHIEGRSLAGSLYPPQTRLFQPTLVTILQVGHGHQFCVKGPIYRFRSRLIHDDRKPLQRWVSSQLSYSAIEAARIETGPHKFRDRLRQVGLMPLFVWTIAYFRAGGPFRGAAALRYAYERSTYESLLAIRLMTSRLEREQRSEKSAKVECDDTRPS